MTDDDVPPEGRRDRREERARRAATEPEASPEPRTSQGSADGRAAWRRLLRMGAPRLTRAQLIAAVLALSLGFAMVTQVRQTHTSGLEDLSQSDLVAVLGNVNNQSSRLDREISSLTRTRDQLRSGQGGAATGAAQGRVDDLGILAGTIAATGPGITVTINDPSGGVGAPNVLDTVQELRDAGAEAIQVGTVRVVADSWFAADERNQLVVDDTVLRPPYVVTAIGDPHTLSTAMAIPGGVTESLQQVGATAVVKESRRVSVTALRPLSPSRYARPGTSG